jgi:hypothetical protein
VLNHGIRDVDLVGALAHAFCKSQGIDVAQGELTLDSSTTAEWAYPHPAPNFWEWLWGKKQIVTIEFHRVEKIGENSFTVYGTVDGKSWTAPWPVPEEG